MTTTSDSDNSQRRNRRSYSPTTCAMLALLVLLAFSAGFAFGVGERARRGLEWQRGVRLDAAFEAWKRAELEHAHERVRVALDRVAEKQQQPYQHTDDVNVH